MRIFIACILTVIIETAFLMLTGLRKKEQVPIIALVNVVSNLTLNLLMLLLPLNFANYFWQAAVTVIVLEATVIFSEYFVYRASFGDLKRLFVKTMLANILSAVSCAFLLPLF